MVYLYVYIRKFTLSLPLSVEVYATTYHYDLMDKERSTIQRLKGTSEMGSLFRFGIFKEIRCIHTKNICLKC